MGIKLGNLRKLSALTAWLWIEEWRRQGAQSSVDCRLMIDPPLLYVKSLFHNDLGNSLVMI